MFGPWEKECYEKIKMGSKMKSSKMVDMTIVLRKSIFEFYKEYKNENHSFRDHGKLLYFFDIFKIWCLKRYLQKMEYEKLLDHYLNENEGWYTSNYIPKIRNNRAIEIIDPFDKKKIVFVDGYGFYRTHERQKCSFGWLCWVKYWRFIKDDLNKEIEEIER